MIMTRKEFIDLTGQDPEDMFGPDWENYLEELSYNPDRSYELVNDLQAGTWPAGQRRVED